MSDEEHSRRWPSRSVTPESETPETDALTIDGSECKPGMAYVFAQDAHSLERRLTEYQAKHTAIMQEADRRYDELVTALSLAQTEINGLQAERDLHYTRLAGLLFSGALDKYTGGDVQSWAAEYTRKLADAQARIAELEKDAARWRGLKGLAGHLQDGSQTTVLLDQDDATRTAFIKVGQKYYAVDGCGFNAALDAALKDHA